MRICIILSAIHASLTLQSGSFVDLIEDRNPFRVDNNPSYYRDYRDVVLGNIDRNLECKTELEGLPAYYDMKNSNTQNIVDENFEKVVECYDEMARLPVILEKSDLKHRIPIGRNVFANLNTPSFEEAPQGKPCREAVEAGRVPVFWVRIADHCLPVALDTGASLSIFPLKAATGLATVGADAENAVGDKVPAKVASLSASLDFGTFSVYYTPVAFSEGLTQTLEDIGVVGLIGLPVLSSYELAWIAGPEGASDLSFGTIDDPGVVVGSEPNEITVGYDASKIFVPVETNTAIRSCGLDTGSARSFIPRSVLFATNAEGDIKVGSGTTPVMLGAKRIKAPFAEGTYEILIDGVTFEVEDHFLVDDDAPCIVGWDVMRTRNGVLDIGSNVWMVGSGSE